MENKPLTRDSEFVVSHNKWLMAVVSGIFFSIFMFGFLNANRKGWETFNYSYLIFLFISIIFLVRMFRKHIYIRINKRGIYQNEELLTEWRNFLKADVIRLSILFSWSDDLALKIEYMKDRDDKGYRKNLRLSNFHDQSIEDLVAAIRFFWNAYCEETGEDSGNADWKEYLK